MQSKLWAVDTNLEKQKDESNAGDDGWVLFAR